MNYRVRRLPPTLSSYLSQVKRVRSDGQIIRQLLGFVFRDHIFCKTGVEYDLRVKSSTVKLYVKNFWVVHVLSHVPRPHWELFTTNSFIHLRQLFCSLLEKGVVE